MTNINKKLKELNPHVVSIRLTKGLSVVDTYFKEGWTLPKSNLVGVEPIPDKNEYFMLYPKDENIGVDEIFEYITNVINVNIERENKIKLLQTKVNELKVIFSKNSLKKCEKLVFNFKDTVNVDDEITLSDIPLINEVDEVNEVDETIKFVESLNDKADGEVMRFNNQTAKVNNEVFDLPTKRNGKIVVEEYAEPEIICKCDPNNPNDVCPVCIDY